jgi:hypothetical protein
LIIGPNRRVLVVVGIIALLAITANYASLLNSHAEQDDCAFGPVSNQQYRGYLLEAKNRQRTKWPAFDSENREMDRQLNFRLSDMLGAEKSIYIRIAIMHAILRALGAEYLNTNGRRDVDSYEAAVKHRQPVVFNYQLDINRFVWFQLYPRQVWLQAVLADPQATRPEILERYGYQHYVAHVLYFIDRPPKEALLSLGQSCPPAPAANAATLLRAVTCAQ